MDSRENDLARLSEALAAAEKRLAACERRQTGRKTLWGAAFVLLGLIVAASPFDTGFEVTTKNSGGTPVSRLTITTGTDTAQADFVNSNVSVSGSLGIDATPDATRQLSVGGGASTTRINGILVGSGTYTGIALSTGSGIDVTLGINPGSGQGAATRWAGIDARPTDAQDNGTLTDLVGVVSRPTLISNAVAPGQMTDYLAIRGNHMLSPTYSPTHVGYECRDISSSGETSVFGFRLPTAFANGTNRFGFSQEGGATTMRNRFAGSMEWNLANLTIIGGINNNVALPAGVSQRIVGPSAAFTITGLAGGQDGRLVILMNISSDHMTLAHENSSSAEANRIVTTTGADMTTTGYGVAWLQYDAFYGRWRVLTFQN